MKFNKFLIVIKRFIIFSNNLTTTLDKWYIKIKETNIS